MEEVGGAIGRKRGHVCCVVWMRLGDVEHVLCGAYRWRSRGERGLGCLFFFFFFFFFFCFFCNDIDGSVCFMWFQIINIVGKII